MAGYLGDRPARPDDTPEQHPCPECGVDLETVNREKHAIQHYGQNPIEHRPPYLLARQRKAEILGVDLSEV